MFSPIDKRVYWVGIGALWLLLGAALWAAPSHRPSDCTPWGEPAPWGGSLRCGFSPTVSRVRDAIVRVRIQHPNRIRKASGFRVAEDLILTAAHTIRHPEATERDGKPLDVTFFADDSTAHRFPVRDVSVGPFDPRIYRSRGDWALLKIDPPERFTARFPLGAPCDGDTPLTELQRSG